MKNACVLTALLFIMPAFACIAPPVSIHRSASELVSEAKTIVLVRAEYAPTSDGKCILSVTSTLKGVAPSQLPIACRLPEHGDWMTDFSNHTDKEFWSTSMGRLGVNSNCSVISPAFLPGKTYLLLLGTLEDTKQYEQIGDPADRWFQFVVSELKAARRSN